MTSRTVRDKFARLSQMATLLTLDHTKARTELGWRPRWPLAMTLTKTADWYRAHKAGRDMRAVSEQQLSDYVSA